LGLAICSQLVAMMRGQLRLESQPGKGSTFTVDVAFGRGLEPAAPRPRVAGKSVLVVEDHRATRHMLCDVFSGWNMDVVAAEGAAHAQALVKRHHRAGRHFDLIVLDTTLPDDDGVRLRRSLAAENEGAAWLLLVPGQARPRRELTQPVPGARWFVRVSKPVLPSELCEAVQTLLGAAPRHLPSSAHGAPEVTPPPRALRILVAEDNMMNQKVVQAILRSHAHDVAMVSSGRMALERLGRETFDLVLMDVEMPEMDGLEATRRWRLSEQERGLQRTPMVALTAQAMTGDRERCLGAGLDAYLAKPLDSAELQRTIAALAGARSSAPASLSSLSPLSSHSASSRDEEVEPFDRQALLRRWGNDPAAFAEIGALFRSNARRLLEELNPQLKEHDPKARRTLHQLKGMLLNLSAEGAVACARKVEHSCKEGIWDEATLRDDLADLHRHVTRVETALAGSQR
jgi:CheY-like chemotaxis protein/HPt (histidine-containing phosphotransfer) domain-containing protein